MQRILFSFPLSSPVPLCCLPPKVVVQAPALRRFQGAGDPAAGRRWHEPMDLAAAPRLADRTAMLSSSRSQKREAKQRQEMIDGVKIGDKASPSAACTVKSYVRAKVLSTSLNETTSSLLISPQFPPLVNRETSEKK